MLNYKLQITNYRQITNHKTQIFGNCKFGYCVLFVICILFIGIFNVYALNLDNLKVSFLAGDYKAAILEGEKIMSGASKTSDLDELYYILGLSYLKDGNYLRASDIFEIILKEFKDAKFNEEARLSLADTYFLRGDFNKAQTYYKELIRGNPHTKLKAEVYYRLSRVGFKKGDTQEAKIYLNRLKQEFPLTQRLILNKELTLPSDTALDIYYTVQVGSFSNITNAKNLTQRLIQKGYPAYMEEAIIEGKTSYRVRVGKSFLHQEIENLENKLIQEGYPTKIYP